MIQGNRPIRQLHQPSKRSVSPPPAAIIMLMAITANIAVLCSFLISIMVRCASSRDHGPEVKNSITLEVELPPSQLPPVEMFEEAYDKKERFIKHNTA